MSSPIIINTKGSIKGYKAFYKDKKGIYTDGMGSGKKTYFKTGKTYTVKGKPVLCQNGYHFFESLVFAINYLEEGNDIYEVESLGDVQKDTYKLTTNKIKIGKKVRKKYIQSVIDKNKNSGNSNSGNYNSGNSNSGDYNSGNRNSGNRNSGNSNSGNSNSGSHNSGIYNSGIYNSGDYNSGNYNSGDRNSGNSNSGIYNSGNRNSGNRNSGSHNSGDHNSGDGYWNYFCNDTKYFLFGVEVTKEDRDKVFELDISWFSLFNKDGSERSYKEAWKKCPEDVLQKIKKLPNFDAKIFKDITGRVIK